MPHQIARRNRTIIHLLASVALLICPALAVHAAVGFSIFNITPASNLLPSGTSSLVLSFDSSEATTCGWSMDPDAALDAMAPFEQQPTTAHQGTVTGMAVSPAVVNTVYLRCAADPSYSQSVQYRDVAARDGSFPRIGNIWNGAYEYATAPEQAAQVQLYLGPYFDSATATALRNANPQVIILPSFNATSAFAPLPDIPDSYYLKDVNGNKIEDWPGGYYLLNLTKPEVADFLANEAYQFVLQNLSTSDGIFWDNVFLSISWQTTDVNGNPVQISSADNGIADAATTLDAAWRTGVIRVFQTFRQLAPAAYMSGHLGQVPPDPGELASFNGDSLIFDAVDAREGLSSFDSLLGTYNAWFDSGRAPVIAMVQSSPPNQIAYGYGFTPPNVMLPSVLQFAQTWYPNMRFGLAVALMNDGFFTANMGDTAAPVNWWYDEYNFVLGMPIGPATRLSSGGGPNLVSNGSFEQGLDAWYLYVDPDGQAVATVSTDPIIVAEGSNSALINVAAAGTMNWHINLSQGSLSFAAGTNYQLQFWARSDRAGLIDVALQSGTDYSSYGLFSEVSLAPTWQLFTLGFVAPVTAADGLLVFDLGTQAGNVWLDGIRITAAAPDLYSRDFTLGKVLLNGTTVPQTFTPGPGFRRFNGTQAPRWQYIVDDASAAFVSTGAWKAVTYNSGGGTPSGETVSGPYYHAWAGGCHQLDSGPGEAVWSLGITEDGTYSLSTWLAAAPGASGWTHDAIYELVGNDGQVLYSTTLDQSSAAAGDQWHVIAKGLTLTAASSPVLRVHNGAGSGSLIADAVYVYSAALYNDGSAAPTVTLAPMDGILLQRVEPAAAPASRVDRVTDAASYTGAIAPGEWVSIFGSGFSSGIRIWTSADFVHGQLPLSLDGVSASIDGQPAYIEYVSPEQINVLAPADSNSGRVSVQVTTRQGASYSGNVMLQRLAPQLFTWAPGAVTYVAAEHADGSLVGPPTANQPARVGEIVEVYGTGFGATSPDVPVSQAVFQPVVLASPVNVAIGGAPARVAWAGLIGPGLYQINVQVPDVAQGDQPVVMSVAGFQSAAGLFLPVTR